MKARKLKVNINMDSDWIYCVYRNRGQWSITLRVMSLDRCSNFAILENFHIRFLRTMKARKLKVCINIDNDLLYCVYRNGGQGSITLGVMSLGRFSKKLKYILFYNIYLCGPTLMKLIPHFKVRKV